jgi:Uma2 family endonuclease
LWGKYFACPNFNLTPEQKERFIPLCPDFVIELLSPSDSLKVAQEKMKEY